MNVLPETVTAVVVSVLKPFAPSITDADIVRLCFGKNETNVPEEPLTKKETAKYLKVSLRTIDNYISQGRIKAVKMGKRLTRIDAKSVRNFINGAC